MQGAPALAQKVELPPKPPLGKGGVPYPPPSLAHQIASRTTDLIAVGVVLIGGLTIGHSVVEWWRAESPPANSSAALPSPGLGTDQFPLQLEFGDARLALTRQVVAGDEAAAHERLIALCRQITEAAHDTPKETVFAAENELLAKTDRVEPVAGVPGAWGVYRLGEEFALVVGIRYFAESAGTSGPPWDVPALSSRDSSNPKSKIQSRKSSSRRLVCWGLAFPEGDARWMLSVFTAAGIAPASPGDWPDVQVPPGARRSLAMRDQRGGGLIGFSGAGEPADWREFFSNDLQQSGWSAPAGWQQMHNRNSARFVGPTQSGAGTIEILFSTDRNRQLTGLIQLLPGPDAIRE